MVWAECVFGELGSAAARVVSSTQVACLTPRVAAPAAVSLSLRQSGPASGGGADLSANALTFSFYPDTALVSPCSLPLSSSASIKAS